MKKLFTVVMLCLLSMTTFAKKENFIASDQITQVGREITTMDLSWSESALSQFQFKVKRIVSPQNPEQIIEESIIFHLVILGKKNYFTIPDNAKLHLKLQNGTIISLPIKKGITKEDNVYAKFNFATAGNHIYPEYIISPEAKELILNNPVIKIRIETSSGQTYLDIPLDKEDKEEIDFQQVFCNAILRIDKMLGISETRLVGF